MRKIFWLFGLTIVLTIIITIGNTYNLFTNPYFFIGYLMVFNLLGYIEGYHQGK